MQHLPPEIRIELFSYLSLPQTVSVERVGADWPRLVPPAAYQTFRIGDLLSPIWFSEEEHVQQQILDVVLVAFGRVNAHVTWIDFTVGSKHIDLGKNGDLIARFLVQLPHWNAPLLTRFSTDVYQVDGVGVVQLIDALPNLKCLQLPLGWYMSVCHFQPQPDHLQRRWQQLLRGVEHLSNIPLEYETIDDVLPLILPRLRTLQFTMYQPISSGPIWDRSCADTGPLSCADAGVRVQRGADGGKFIDGAVL